MNFLYSVSKGLTSASLVEFPHRSFHVQTSTLRCAKIDSGSNRRSKRRLGKGSMVDWVVGFTSIWVVLLVNIGKLYHFGGIFHIFTLILGEMIQFDLRTFFKGVGSTTN